MLSLIIKITIILQQRIIIHYKVFKIILQEKLAKNDKRFNFLTVYSQYKPKRPNSSWIIKRNFHLKQLKLLRSAMLNSHQEQH